MSRLYITFFKIRGVFAALLFKTVCFLLQIPIPQKISVGAFIERDGKLLVLDLSYRKGFGFPGGLVENHETLEEALVREVKEETGLTITKQTYLGSHTDTQYGYPVIAAAFIVETEGEIVSSREGTLSWQTLETIKSNCAYRNWVHLLDQHTSSCV